MVEKFLHAKHWQIFLPLFGIPAVFYFIVMGTMVSGLSTGQFPDSPELMFGYMKYFPFVILSVMFVFWGWYWAVGTGLQREIPEEAALKVWRFKAALSFNALYTIFFLSFFAYSFWSFNRGIAQLLGVIVPFHFFAMFCVFYCMYFMAKTIKTAELQRRTHFGDCITDFFLIWFFPIGIWNLQPRINRIARGDIFMKQGGSYHEEFID